MSSLLLLLAVVITGASPDTEASIGKARAAIAEFEDNQALTTLDELLAQSSLSPAEVAEVQVWRAIALLNVGREADADAAIAVARACDPAVALPSGAASPRVAEKLAGIAPGTCTVAAPPAPAIAAEPVKTEEKAPPARSVEDPSWFDHPALPWAGVGAAIAGYPAFLVGVLGTAGGVIVLYIAREATERAQKIGSAREARTGGRVAYGIRWAGRAVILASLAVSIVALVVLMGGTVATGTVLTLLQARE